MEQGTKTGQLLLGSKFTGVASTATALCGTGLPPCPAYDFSCALRGTLARTVEPGENGMPANFSEDSAAFALSIKPTFSVTTSQPTKSNLFSVAHAALLAKAFRGRVLVAASSPRRSSFAIIFFSILSRKDKFAKTRHLRQHAGRVRYPSRRFASAR